ncbi:MAG: hypothetical protein VKJ64_20165, partial [Leptolyngbyaceae bacterium]|nr:hypothetical protein [Leptolyngbyaceae bacterium]
MSTQKQLESIDQALMQLLRERITLMQEQRRESHGANGFSPVYPHKDSTTEALLRQYQIPLHL